MGAETVADNLDELSLRLCALLDVKPEQTTSITLTVEPGTGAVVRWSGYQVVSLADVGRALTGVPDVVPWNGDAGPAGP